MSDAGLTAAILVGGLGTRLRPVVADRPKVLANVAGRPFLAHLLDQLAASGLRDVVLCTGYMAQRVRDEFGDAFGPMRLRWSVEEEPLGTGGALRLALPLLGEGTTVVLNGDSFCDVYLRSLLERHRETRAVASLTLARVPDTSRYGRVEVDGDGVVRSFVEKGGLSGPGFINAGIYALERVVLESIPEGRPVSLERETFPGWIDHGLRAFAIGGRFIDIGTPESYAQADAFFAGGDR